MRFAGLALLASLVLFQGSPAAAAQRPWLALDGSWGTYSMSDVNDELAAINLQLAGTGLSIDELHNGMGIGGRFGIDLGQSAGIGVGYDRLFAHREVSDASGGLEYHLPANAFRAFGEYRLPSAGKAAMRLGLAVGLVSSSGSVKLTDASFGSFKVDLAGSGPLFEAMAGGDYWAAPRLAITGGAGFRYAKIGEVKAESQVVYNADGSKYTLDYSGFLLRLGLKLAFTD